MPRCRLGAISGKFCHLTDIPLHYHRLSLQVADAAVRLEVMEQRLTAVPRAVETVQPALAKFYNSLSDEQKARFNQLGPRKD